MSYFIDYHTHSQLSPDSSVPLEQQAEAAVRSGLSELCITATTTPWGSTAALWSPMTGPRR